jgi:hypothetical protein
MELSPEPAAFSDLIGTPVRSRDGRTLGRVFETRAHRDPDGTIVVDELLVGRRALLQRLWGPGSDAHGIPWEAIVEIRAGQIVAAVPG